MKKEEMRIAQLKAELEKKEMLLDYIDSLTEDLKYYMITERDEEGTPILDENGEEVKKAPTKEDNRWEYKAYTVREMVIGILTEYLVK